MGADIPDRDSGRPVQRPYTGSCRKGNRGLPESETKVTECGSCWTQTSSCPQYSLGASRRKYSRRLLRETSDSASQRRWSQSSRGCSNDPSLASRLRSSKVSFLSSLYWLSG